MPASLVELRGDGRRGAPPGPLGLPLSLLSMGDEPGSSTVFSADADVAAGAAWAASWGGGSEGDAASADSVQPQQGPGQYVGGGAMEQLPGQLWSLGEAELAQHALLALQGVAASLLRLQALLAAPQALPRRSVEGLLRKLAAAGELRQRLQHFVAAFSSGSSGRSSNGGASSREPVQQAFAHAVSDVLQRQAAALQQLEQEQGTSWVQAVSVGGVPGRRLHRRGPTLMQVALHSGRLQLQLRSLADLCWCTSADTVAGEEAGEDADGGSCMGDAARDPQQQAVGGGGGCRWHQGSFPASTHLLDYLYRRANEAGELPS